MKVNKLLTTEEIEQMLKDMPELPSIMQDLILYGVHYEEVIHNGREESGQFDHSDRTNSIGDGKGK